VAEESKISKAHGGPATAVARLETGEQSAHRIAALFAEGFTADDIAVSLVDAGGGRWRVAIHFQADPDRHAVRALTALAAGPGAAEALSFERITATDWVEASLAGLQPVEAGRFAVHGAHDRTRIAVNRIGIEIEAALAFGTGHHGTTRGCLLAFDRWCKSLKKRRAPPVRRDPGVTSQAMAPGVLDLGTGSGVLAIAAARALRRRVLAVDIDPDAVRAARANARLNRVDALVRVVQADGVGQRSQRPFDLVFANILLGPLQRLAAPLTRATAPGARVILSGLLRSQANAVIAAYHGLALERRIALDGWATLVLVRRIRPRPSVARRRRRS
jgi:ribosomal protein L11 methyltransferase